MEPTLECPRCKAASIDLRCYESMIVVAADYALFSVKCPGCGARVSSVRSIPAEMRDEVRYAAIEVGAGMDTR